MNTFYPSGIGAWAYVSDGNQSNRAFSNWHFGFSFNMNGIRIVQIAFNAISSESPKSRFKDSSGTWSAWTNI